MTNQRKGRLGFTEGNVFALLAPVKSLDQHRPHHLDEFTIETSDNYDTVVVSLREVNLVTSTIRITRQSVRFPLSLLAGLAQRHSIIMAESEAFAQRDEDQFGDDPEEAK